MRHMYTHSCPFVILRVLEYIHIWCASFTALPGVLPLHTHAHTHTHTHTHKELSTEDLVDNGTHPYPCPRLIACTNTYFFKFTGANFSHACGDTHNLHTYFTIVKRVFLVEMVILQTVL